MRRWLEPLARTGYATKGVVYLLVGGLALLAAAGEGGKVTGSEGAVATLGAQPFGKLLLLAAAVGLAAYALWRGLQAVFDLQPKGGAFGVFERACFAGSALFHGALAVLTFQLARGERGGKPAPRDLVAGALDFLPLGRVLVAVVGAILLVAAAVQLYQGASGKLEHALADQPRWLVNGGRVGVACRGVVFGIVGIGLVRAALADRASESRDTGGALRELGAQPFGDVLLGVVAAGLAAYGGFMLLSAFVARFRPG